MVKMKRVVKEFTSSRPASAPLPPRRQSNDEHQGYCIFSTAKSLQSMSLHDGDYYHDRGHDDDDEDDDIISPQKNNITHFHTTYSSWCGKLEQYNNNKIIDDTRREKTCQDSTEQLIIMEPPKIKRTLSDFNLKLQERSCVYAALTTDTSAASSWEECSRLVLKDDAFTELVQDDIKDRDETENYKKKNEEEEEKNKNTQQTRTQHSWDHDMENWEPQEGHDSDESTVVISNISATPSLVSNKISSSERKIGNSEDHHESLLDVFQIKLSTPLKLPKEKRWNKLNDFIRSSPSHRSVNAAANDVLADKSGKDDYWFHHATFNQLQQYVLLGVPLNMMDAKKFRSPPRIGTLLKKSNEIMKTRAQTASPARKLDSILSRKQGHRRIPSDSVQRIKTILSRKSAFKVKHPVRSEWSNMDDAVSGRLDGLDVISMGSLRNVSYIGDKQKILSGQRYNLRCMVLDSLWSASGRDPSEIVFEGFSQRGEGNDRWTTRIDDWKSCDTECHDHLWGKGNSPPPRCESKLSGISSSPKSTAADMKLDAYVIRTLEQLQTAHEHAVLPLKVGHVHESIKMFQKILQSLQAKYSNGRGINHVIGSTCHNIAILYMWEGCFEDALNYMNMALSVRVKTLGYFHASVAVSFAKLGIIYFALERLGSSIRSFNQALDIRIKLSDDDSVQTAKILNNLGVALFHQGEKGNAMDRLIDALRIQKKWVEESLCRECSIFDTSITLSNLAKIYYNRFDNTMAAYLYEEALQLQTSILKKDHQVVLGTLCNIALARAVAGEATNSLQIFKTLHNLQSVKFGNESREAVETKGLMSILFIQQSNYTVALRYLNDLLKWQRAHLDENNPSLVNTKCIIEQISHAINNI